MDIKYFKKIKIPNKPGVYFFQKGNDVLYIGKATSLRDRTKSYLSKDLIHTRGPLILDMVFKADKLKWQQADSVLEALILEANLIKKHQPKYNTKEKDDKSFNYVVITKPARTTGVVQSGGEKLPKVIVIRGKNLIPKDFKNIYGPYTNGSQLREALKIIRKIFPFLDEKSKNYMEFYRQINLVPDLQNYKIYLQNIKNIKLFFSGKKVQIFKNLNKEMNIYSKNHEFEKAGEIKRQLFALQHINDVALLKPEPRTYNLEPNFRIEAYDIAHMGGKNMVGVMVVVQDGEVVKSEYKKFKIRTQNDANDTGALKEVLERRLAHREWAYPDLIVVDGSLAQINATKMVLNKMGVKIPIVSVVKDERHKAKAILSSHGEAFFRSSDLRVPSPARPFKKIPRATILLANSEAHRFAIAYHKNMRGRNFLPRLK